MDVGTPSVAASPLKPFTRRRNGRSKADEAANMKLTAIVSMLLISMCGRFNTEKQYRGTPLSGPTYLCSGQDYVAGGFWRDPASGVVTEEAQVDREPTNRWRVMLRGNVASVTSTSGTGDIQTATFTVE